MRSLMPRAVALPGVVESPRAADIARLRRPPATKRDGMKGFTVLCVVVVFARLTVKLEGVRVRKLEFG